MNQLSPGVDEKKMSRNDRVLLRNLRQYAVYAEPDQMRVYPNGSLAAPVLGFSGVEEYKTDGQPVSQIAGRGGVELSLNYSLERRGRLARDGHRQSSAGTRGVARRGRAAARRPERGADD